MTTDEIGDGRESSGASRFERFRRGYQGTAVILLNFFVLVLALNILLGVGFWVKDAFSGPSERDAGDRLFRENGAPVRTPMRTDRQMGWFDFRAYGGIDPAYAADVLDDFYRLTELGFVYQPWVQFVEAPYSGERVHIEIDERGFPIRRTVNTRQTRGGETDTLVRVFVLGGSTSFGDLVSDEHTWPSFLSRILNERAEARGLPYRIEVLNYGRGYFFPTQETALLADLLKSGHRPSLVIFMDGVNWGGEKDVPQFNPEVAQSFVQRQHGAEVTARDFLLELRWIPMVRFAWGVENWLDALAGTDSGEGTGLPTEEWYARAEMAVNRFQQSRPISEAICEQYGCETLFFLQPHTLVGYNFDLYRRELPESFTAARGATEAFYERMKRDPVYIDLSGLFEEWGADRRAVVDNIHYSPGFNRFLAERVAARIDLDELPVFPDVIDRAAATGRPRSVVTKEGWVKTPVEEGGAVGAGMAREARTGS